MDLNLYKTVVPLGFKSIILDVHGDFYSLYNGSPWPSDVIAATCEIAHHPRVPDKDCSCGVYAARTSEGTRMYAGIAVDFLPQQLGLSPRDRIRGHVVTVLIQGLGWVEVHEEGWRAQYARIVYGIEPYRNLFYFGDKEDPAKHRERRSPNLFDRVGARLQLISDYDAEMLVESQWRAF